MPAKVNPVFHKAQVTVHKGKWANMETFHLFDRDNVLEKHFSKRANILKLAWEANFHLWFLINMALKRRNKL